MPVDGAGVIGERKEIFRQKSGTEYYGNLPQPA